MTELTTKTFMSANVKRETWRCSDYYMFGQLSDELKNERPEVSWKLIKDMRNLFTHNYSRVDNEIVWDTLKNNIPDLREKYKRILVEDLFE